MEKLVHGVGINDISTPITRSVNNKIVWYCPYHEIWKHMLRRAYSAEWRRNSPSYIGVTVNEKWHRFSVFKSWLLEEIERIGGDFKDYELDKDLLIIGNKEYAPEKCILVKSNINKLFNDSGKTTGLYPTGVTYLANRKMCYVARISIDGVRKRIGGYLTIEEAEQAYIQAKIDYINDKINETNDIKLKHALENYINYYSKKLNKGNKDA